MHQRCTRTCGLTRRLAQRGAWTVGQPPPAPTPPPGTQGGTLFARWWWQGCRGRATSPRSLIDRYEREVEEQAMQHELQGWCVRC